jgi:hypothetical protein
MPQELSGIIGSPENDVIPRSFQDHSREIINKEMVLRLKNGILLDGIAITILTFFLPHTLKLQNPKFCGVSQAQKLFTVPADETLF